MPVFGGTATVAANKPLSSPSYPCVWHAVAAGKWQVHAAFPFGPGSCFWKRPFRPHGHGVVLGNDRDDGRFMRPTPY